MKYAKGKFWVASGIAGVMLAVALVRCGSGLPGGNATNWLQVERLGRPAINEGLVYTNAYLNAFNSIAPSVDLTTAASAVGNEAGTVLGFIHTLAQAVYGDEPTVANVVGGFLPDVMRIDTTQSIAVATASYNTFTNNNVTKPIILIGGRKLTDDVINITLGYLFHTSPLDTAASANYDDGVSYYGGVSGNAAGTTCAGNETTGSNPGAPGHHCLNGQTTFYGAASFPFLAAAN